jgi:carbon-monoxide dehydrogenase large subunit
MDYALPRALGRAELLVENHSVPCKTNLLGVKGCGEAGCAGALPSVVKPWSTRCRSSHRHIDMPLTPEKVWRRLNAAGSPLLLSADSTGGWLDAAGA